MLDSNTQTQLKSLFSALDSNYRLVVESKNHPAGSDLVDLLNGVAASSDRIEVVEKDAAALRFTIERNEEALPLVIRGIPGGHEFTTLILAILNADGKGKLPDEGIQNRIKALKGSVRLISYVSTSCVNCPDVVQALNQMALIHDDFHHEMVEGTHFQKEIEARKIQGVPAVFAGDKLIHAGKADLTELLDKLARILHE